MIKYDIQQHSEAWFDLKLGKFSGTRFIKVMSDKSTASYKDVIGTVAGEIISGISEPMYVSADMDRGTELEPIARVEYENLTGYKVNEVGFISPESDLSEWVGVSPDGLINEDGGLEIKCPKINTYFSYLKAGKLPNEYKWQVQGQLWVSGLEWWDFMAYYPNLKPFIIRVYPDLEMHKLLESNIYQAINDVKELIDIYNKYE